MKNKINQFIAEGIAWINDGKYYKKCPSCSNVLTYSQTSHLIRSIKNNNVCVTCSNNNPIKRNIISVHMRGVSKSPAHVKKMSDMRKGLPSPIRGISKSDAHKKKLSLSHMGKKLSAESIEKMMASRDKTRYKRTPYSLPNGEIVYLQGYESQTLDLLLSSSISPTSIKIKHSDKPVIQYECSGSIKKYYPDCFLCDTNTLVETKSTWTWKTQLNENIAKISGSTNAGYNIRVIIWNDKRVITSDKTYFCEKKST